MAQYKHLPIYKQTYDLLVRVTEITRGYPRDFKPIASKIREQVMEVVLLIYRANSVRARLADKARNAGLRPNPALTKETPCNT